MFSDEKSVGACVEQKIDVGFAVNSAFHHEKPIVGNELRKLQRRLKVDVERLQIAIVHADDRGARLEGFAEFGFVVDLDQRIQLEVMSKGDEFLQLRRLKHRDDKQDGACARRARLVDLKRLVDEILSKDRQF